MRLISEDAVPFPQKCSGGVLKLEREHYKVASPLVFEEDCEILGPDHLKHGQALVRLEAELVFKRSLSFKGSVNFVGTQTHRCIDAQENASFKHAKVSFRHCGAPDVEDGGGLYVEGKLEVSFSKLSFQSCRAMYGGGLFVGGGWKLLVSTLHLVDCHANGAGGGVFIFGNSHIARMSELVIESCTAKEEGGGLVLRNGALNTGGYISLRDVRAQSAGGLSVPNQLTQNGGSIEGRNCTAEYGGAGVLQVGYLIQKDGHIEISDSHAFSTGGGIHAEWRADLHGTSRFVNVSAHMGGGALLAKHLNLHGQMEVRNSKGMEGGALLVSRSLFIGAMGELDVRNTSAGSRGGGIFCTALSVQGGMVRMEETDAVRLGGAIYAASEVSLNHGVIHVIGSRATVGGAIYAIWVMQFGGRIELSDVATWATGVSTITGGGIAAPGGFVQDPKGEIFISNASATMSGGAITASMMLIHGNLSIKDSSALEGGCVRILNSNEWLSMIDYSGRGRSRVGKTIATLQILAQKNFGNSTFRIDRVAGYRRAASLLGHTSFQRCRAEVGGALLTSVPAEFAEVSFEGCVSSSVAGGSAVKAPDAYFHRPVVFKDCQSPGNAVLLVEKLLSMQNASFQNCSAPQAVGFSLSMEHVIVTQGDQGAAFLAHNRSFAHLECDNGFEGYQDKHSTKCRQCRMGYFQLQGGYRLVNGVFQGKPCIKAPAAATVLSPMEVQFRRGNMADEFNLSASLHCPNQMACPGGKIIATGIEGMCEKGYEGSSCATCAATHGRVTSDPFTCATCATSSWRKSFQWAVYILENSVVFAVSASGVMSVGDQSYRSTVYSNQLMSYVMVSVPVLNQVSNSRSFRGLAEVLQEIIDTLAIPVDLANGAGSEGQSTECLLDYLGISKTLYGGDLLFLFLAFFMWLILSMQVDVWSAIVVAGNCYLPRLCFAVGRHLVCYRENSEAEGGQLICGFDHDVSMPMALAIVILLVLFVVGPGSWLWLMTHHATTPGALYLTQPYKASRTSWEVTVLLRKLLLALVASVWPSSSNAVMQLSLLGLILLGFLVATMQNSPYLKEEHNLTEACLLTMAVLMTLVTFSFQANEQNWAKTEITQAITMAFIVLLATGPAVVMTIKVVWALLVEFEIIEEAEVQDGKAADGAHPWAG